MSTPRTRRWNVLLTAGEYHDVGAANCEIEGGALVFRDQYGKIVQGYAPHRWAEVTPE